MVLIRFLKLLFPVMLSLRISHALLWGAAEDSFDFMISVCVGVCPYKSRLSGSWRHAVTGMREGVVLLTRYGKGHPLWQVPPYLVLLSLEFTLKVRRPAFADILPRATGQKQSYQVGLYYF